MTTLLELSEPIFQYLCRLNRMARKGGHLEPSLVRSDLNQLFRDFRTKAAQAGKGDQVDKVELPLIFFTDFIIHDSGLPFSNDWEDIAHERNELAGDEKFWDLLEDELVDSSQGAAERLTVYYACIGLGFTGWYTGQPEFLRKKMKEIYARIREQVDPDQLNRICPEAYENVDTSDLIEPPGRSLIGLIVGLVGMTVVLLLGNCYVYFDQTRELDEVLDKIIQSNSGTEPAAQGEE